VGTQKQPKSFSALWLFELQKENELEIHFS